MPRARKLTPGEKIDLANTYISDGALHTGAGSRVTTFDLWSGSTLPAELAERFADTAKFLNGAERVTLSGEIQTCWEPSSNKTEPYPLPASLRGLA